MLASGLAGAIHSQAPAQALPFPDSQFDVALSTLMLHHLPRNTREQCGREIARVLKPGGRLLAVDFSAPAREHSLRSPETLLLRLKSVR